MIYRYKIKDDRIYNETDNLQLETWGVAAYKGYYFLYSYADMSLGQGNFNSMYQIVEMSSNSYTIVDRDDELVTSTFVAKELNRDNGNTYLNIQGKWSSHNSKNEDYGSMGEFVKNNRNEYKGIALFEGALNLNIEAKELYYEIDTIKSPSYIWKLGKDAKVLILESEISDPIRNGIHVDYADILELTEDSLKLRLFTSEFYTGLNNPRRYLLNRVQNFKRVE